MYFPFYLYQYHSVGRSGMIYCPTWLTSWYYETLPGFK